MVNGRQELCPSLQYGFLRVVFPDTKWGFTTP
jgi:hypothetical protein